MTANIIKCRNLFFILTLLNVKKYSHYKGVVFDRLKNYTTKMIYCIIT